MAKGLYPFPDFRKRGLHLLPGPKGAVPFSQTAAKRVQRGAPEFPGTEENPAVPSPARRERVAEGRVRALAIAPPLTPTLSPRKDGWRGSARKRWRTRDDGSDVCWVFSSQVPLDGSRWPKWIAVTRRALGWR